MPNPLNVPITPPRVAFIDPRSGTVSREWYMFFLSLFQTAGGSTVSLDDVQKGPPMLTVDEINVIVDKASENLRPSTESTIEQIAELRKQIEALEVQVRPELGTLSQLQQDNVPWLQFDTTPVGFPTGAAAHGTLYWDDADRAKTLSLVMEDTGGVVQQIGEETYYRIKADSTITNGQVIMFTGSLGASGGLKGAPATGLTATQSEYIMGVATQDIATNSWGYVTWFGEVRGVNTTGGAEAWVDGQILYYNPAVAGGLTKNVPVAPNPKVIVASVVHAATNGTLFVRPTFGSALGQTDSNVEISGLANGDLLQYDGVQQRWENVSLSAAGFGTMALQNANSVAITGGSINGTTIGATTPAAATFTSLSSNGTTTLVNGSGSLSIDDGGGSIANFRLIGPTAALGRIRLYSPNQLRISTGATNSINFYTAASSTPSGEGNLQLQVSNTASAVNYVQVTGAATGSGVVVSAQGSDTNISVGLRSKGTGEVALGTGGTFRAFSVTGTSGANYLQATSAAATQEPILSAQGSDTNISMVFQSKGTGGIRNLTGTGQEQLRVAHTASAVNYVQVTGAATGGNVIISTQGSDASVFGTLLAKGSGGWDITGNGASTFRNSAGANQFRVTPTTSAVNLIQATGAVAGSAPSFASIGSDTNIDLALTPKGTGLVRFGTYTANMALTVQGYIEIKDSGGTVRKLAVIS